MIIFIIKDKIMAFRTKLDYSDNRQIKQRERTSTTLSGATVFGVPFSALTSGPSTTDSGTTETYPLALSTFSGNSATTVFTWYDSRMSLAEPEILRSGVLYQLPFTGVSIEVLGSVES